MQILLRKLKNFFFESTSISDVSHTTYSNRVFSHHSLFTSISEYTKAFKKSFILYFVFVTFIFI